MLLRVLSKVSSKIKAIGGGTERLQKKKKFAMKHNSHPKQALLPKTKMSE